MIGVRPRLIQGPQGKILGRRASAQAFDLRENKPHPMGGFAAAAQLLEDPVEHRLLSVQVAFQAVHGAFIHEPPQQNAGTTLHREETGR